MPGSQQVGERLSLVLDEELRKCVSDVADRSKEGVAAILRKAIRHGLPLVESPGDVVQLDGPLRAEIAAAAERLGKSVEQLLVESIRIGFGPYFVQCTRSHIVQGKPVNLEDVDTRFQSVFKATPEGGPSGHEHLQSLRTIRALGEQLADLKQCVPEVNERLQAIAYLQALWKAKGTWHGYPFGLPMSEIQSQIAELEGEKSPTPAPPKAPAEPTSLPKTGSRKKRT